MKILKALIGLVFFAGGVYGTLWVYGQFQDFELTYLALYLGGALLAMVLGLFLFLLQFRKQPENGGVVFRDDVPSNEFEDSYESETEEILMDEPVELLREEQKAFEAIPEPKPEPEEPTRLFKIEATYPMEVVHEPVVESKEVDEEPDEATTETLKLFFQDNQDSSLEEENEVFEEKTTSVDCRLIGIDAWSNQRILRKLDEGAEVSLRMKPKRGLTMAEVLYQGKPIGYLSKVEYLKVEETMYKLTRIAISTMVKEGRSVKTVYLRLYFRVD